MQRRAITTLLLGIVPVAISLSACASTRQITELEALVQSDEKVFILVRANGSGGGTILVHPELKEACHPARTDCGEKIRWKVRGPIGDWKVSVAEKSGGYPGCFTAFELDKNHRENVQKPSEDCQKQEEAEWYYDVVLKDARGNLLAEIDPLVLVSWTPGP